MKNPILDYYTGSLIDILIVGQTECGKRKNIFDASWDSFDLTLPSSLLSFNRATIEPLVEGVDYFI
jgi:hypothetical protein